MRSVLLRRATLLYLGLPVALFLAGWFRAPLAVPGVGLLGWGIWRMGWRKEDPAGAPGSWRHVVAGLSGVLLPCVAFVLMSGAGGWGSGDSDWFKHDTILRDLIERPWPVVYQTSAGPVLLVYYVSFYLPAAVVGKLTGSPFLAGQTLALTMLVGMLLTLAWFRALGGGGRGGWWRAAGMFFLFSGLDVVGKGLVNLRLGLPVGYGDWNDVEWWAQVFQYSSNPAALFWAPHQALGAWLPAALWLERCLGGAGEDAAESAGTWLLPLGLSALWSPFATLGLLPLAAGMLLWRRGQWRVTDLLCPANVAGATAGLAAVAYFSARWQPFRVPAWAEITPGHQPTPLVEGDGVSWVVVYITFVLLEFGLLAMVLTGALRRRERPLLTLAAGSLLALPWVHYGFANDLVMRGGLPALFVVQVLVLRMLMDPERRRSAAGWTVAGLLAVGALNAGLEYQRHVARMVRDRSWRDDTARQPVRSLFELQRGIYNQPGFDFVRQYLGSTESFYARWLGPANRPAPRPVDE